MKTNKQRIVRELLTISDQWKNKTDHLILSTSKNVNELKVLKARNEMYSDELVELSNLIKNDQFVIAQNKLNGLPEFLKFSISQRIFEYVEQ